MESIPIERAPRRARAAVLLSLVHPGLGHFAYGEWGRGAIWCGALVLFQVADIALLRSAGSRRSFLILFGLLIVAGLFARVGAPVDALRNRNVQRFVPALEPVLAFSALAFCLSISVSVGIRSFVLEAFKLPSGSMIPAIQPGDHIFVDKLAYASAPPRRGDVVLFRYPKDPNADFIKRVVAVAGDVVEHRSGVLYLNGSAVPHQGDGAEACSYEDRLDDDPGGAQWTTHPCRRFRESLDGHDFDVVESPDALERSFAPVTVPPRHVYVLGDNRDNSHDSRYWGMLPLENIKGKGLAIWYSAGGPQGTIRWGRIGKLVE